MSAVGKSRGRLATMLVCAALVLSTLISGWQAITANARAAAEWEARQTEMRLREQAQASELRVQEVAAEAQSIVRFLGEWVVGASRPVDQTGGLGKDVTLHDAINSAEVAAATAFPKQPLTEAMVRTLLGRAYSDRGDGGAAIRQLEQAVELTREKLGDEHLDTVTSINNLAVTYAKFGQFDSALACFDKTHRRLQSVLPPNHPDLLISMHNLASVYQNLGQLDQAISLMEETLRRQQATLGPQHVLIAVTMTNLAVVHDMAHRYGQAESLFRQSLRIQQGNNGQLGLMLDTQAFLGRTLLHQEKHSEAVAILVECTSESRTIQPHLWQTYYYQTLLGGALSAQARNLPAASQNDAGEILAQAEALLRQGCEGMLARDDSVFAQHKPLIAEALQRLIELYKQLDRPDAAARWKTELRARTSTPNLTRCDLESER